MRVTGVPTGARPRAAGTWRERVGALAAGAVPARSGLVLRFTLRPKQFVDLDTLVQSTVAGLRDAGVYARGLRGLDAVVADKRDGGDPGVDIEALPAADVAALAPPGPVDLDVTAAALPGVTRPGKVAWRTAVARRWARAPLPDAPVWAEVALATAGSLLAPLEPVLDALEPVLGRDPRGRPWQEFFPADDRITWLRVVRAEPGEPLLRLRLGASDGPPRFHSATAGSR